MAISFRIPSSLRRSEYKQGRSRKNLNGIDLNTQEYYFGDEDVAEDEITSEVIQLHTQTRSRFMQISPDTKKPNNNYSKKDSVKYSIKPGDTLQSVSLKYGCSISELKRSNNLISDQDFYALIKIKIPIKEHSLLSEILPLSPSNSSDESSQQLCKTFHVSIGQMFQEDKSNQAKSFLEDMDKDIQRIVEKTQNTKPATQEEQQTALSVKNFQPLEERKQYDGSNWGINWCSLIIVILILGILAPTFYGIYIAVSEHRNNTIAHNVTSNM